MTTPSASPHLLSQADSALFPSEFVISHWGRCGNVCEGLEYVVCLPPKRELDSERKNCVLWLTCSLATIWFPSSHRLWWKSLYGTIFN